MTDARLVRALCAWFARHARDLPWRTPGEHTRRDPYQTLVSEIMLQQTQVARVSEKFGAFMDRFPTPGALASASEDDVLAMWSGLGYYRRARSLRAAAKQVSDEHAGVVPSDVAALIELKGVGRYTAGAIASIAYDMPAPIVDGNVTRVVLRLEGRDLASDDREAQELAWRRSDELVATANRSRASVVSPGTFNEALMELGATVCTPANPRCPVCPIMPHCQAVAEGTADSIPKPKARAKRKPLYCASAVCAQDDRLLVRRRPDSGLWAGLYEAPTIEQGDSAPSEREITEALHVRIGALIGEFDFATTHRDVRFRVFAGESASAEGDWRTREEISRLALSSPQRRILLGP